MKASVKAGVSEPDQKPAKPSIWVRLGRIIYNRETGAILTRTPLSWLKITLLTLSYWAIVAISALICWAIFQVTVFFYVLLKRKKIFVNIPLPVIVNIVG
jgi:Sodium / potassium ATPase beta chain